MRNAESLAAVEREREYTFTQQKIYQLDQL